jgi:hypothetical protein
LCPKTPLPQEIGTVEKCIPPRIRFQPRQEFMALRRLSGYSSMERCAAASRHPRGDRDGARATR